MPQPLAGQRILVTRPRDQAAELVARLESLGAHCDALPVIAIEPPPDWAPVAERIDRLAEFDWLVFTSANGVRMLFDWMIDSGRGLDAVWQVKVAAIGPATADQLRRYGVELHLVPAEHRAEGLIAELAEAAAGAAVLVARADCGRELLIRELSRVCRVETVAVYRQLEVVNRGDPVYEKLRRGEFDWITLTSANIARALLTSLDGKLAERLRGGSPRIASISPITSDAIRELGFPVAAEAREHTTEGMIASMIESSLGT